MESVSELRIRTVVGVCSRASKYCTSIFLRPSRPAARLFAPVEGGAYILKGPFSDRSVYPIFGNVFFL